MSKQTDDEKKIHGMAADLRIIAADISNAAKNYECRISRLQDEIAEHEKTIRVLGAQMKADAAEMETLRADKAARPDVALTRDDLCMALSSAMEYVDGPAHDALKGSK